MRPSGVVLAALILLTACGGGGGATPAVGANTAGSAPVPTSIAVSFGDAPNAVAGLAQVFPLKVVLKDQHGNAIQGTYAQAITLSDSDTSGATKLSTTTVTSSTQSVSLTYSGARVSGPVTISASTPGISAGNVSSATLSIDGSRSYVPGEKFTYQRTTDFTETQRNSQPQSGEEIDTITVDVQPSPVTFNGQSGLTDVVTWYVNASAGVGDTTHDYYGYSQDNPVKLLHYGWSDQTTLTYVSPTETVSSTFTYDAPSVVDELPQTSGATWNPAQASHETDSDRYTDIDGVAHVDTEKWVNSADGSYENALESVPANAPGEVIGYMQSSANSNASFAFADVTASSTSQPYSTSVTGDVPTSAGIPYHLDCNSDALHLPAAPLFTVTASSFPTPAPSVTPYPRCSDPQTGTPQMATSISTSEPNWYPANALPLDQEQYTVVGTNVPIPTNCQVPASLATSANQLHYTQQLLDPVREKLQLTQDSYFAPNVGLVCILQTANLSFYAVASWLGTPSEQIRENVVYTLVPSASASAVGMRRTNSISAIGGLVAANMGLHERARLLLRHRRGMLREHRF